MHLLKDLADRPMSEKIDFVSSFNTVLSDLDGVVWTNNATIPGAPECLTKLKQMGKEIKFITDNTINTTETISKKLRSIGIEADVKDVSNPIIFIIDYLRKIAFKKSLYVLASEAFKDELRKAGFKIIENMPQTIEESISKLPSLIQDDEDVGAVIIDIDLNLTLIKLQRALTFLKRKDCLFLVGSVARSLAMGNIGPIIGVNYFHEILKEMSGREYTVLAKPSLEYAQYLLEKYNLGNPEKVLFIGDSIRSDMAFATVAGFQKLLTLSGNVKKASIENWKHPEESKPEFYVESLGALNKILTDIAQ